MRATNEAWKLQKDVLSKIEEGRKQAILASKIDLNSAPVDHLQLLGLSVSQINEIVEKRQEAPFRSLKQVQDLYGFGVKTIEKIKPHTVILPQN